MSEWIQTHNHIQQEQAYSVKMISLAALIRIGASLLFGMETKLEDTLNKLMVPKLEDTKLL